MENNTMLGKIVNLLVTIPDRFGVILDLTEKLASDAGAEWYENLRKFLRKETCWVNATVQVAATSFITATYKFVVNYSRSVSLSLAAGKYDWKNSDINDSNFQSAEAGEHKVEMAEFWFKRTISSKDAITKMDKAGYRPATMKELLSFGEKNPKIQLNHPVVELGSVAGLYGFRLVGCLYRFGTGRRVDLDYFDDDWYGYCRFLGVRLPAQAGKNSVS